MSTMTSLSAFLSTSSLRLSGVRVYLEFFIFMQDVLFELILILLQDLDVRHSVVEMGGNEFLEVTHVHELWVDAFKHFLVEVELQHVFVFFSVTDESWVKEFKWSCPG